MQGSAQLEYNYGYDDEKGDYKVINNDHIGFRFEIKSFLGKGSFGTALKCFDHKNGVDVAVKVVKNKKKYYYQAGVELKILQFLKENDPEDIMNVIHLNNYVVFRKHLCIGFELMSMNLFEFLKINDFNVSSVDPRATQNGPLPLPPYSLYFHCLGIRPQPDSKVRHPAPLRPQVPQDVPDYSL